MTSGTRDPEAWPPRQAGLSTRRMGDRRPHRGERALAGSITGELRASTITWCSKPRVTNSRSTTRGEFGTVDLLETERLDQWPIAALGPEPLGDELTPAYLKAAGARRPQAGDQAAAARPADRRPGSAISMSAKRFYRAGISPLRAGGAASLPILRKLVPAIRAVLTESIEDGGSTLRDYAPGRTASSAILPPASTSMGARESPAATAGNRRSASCQGGASTWVLP